MACAYQYAENAGPMPRHYEQLKLIDRFGVKAVLGREMLTYNEIVCMHTTETIIESYRERSKSANWQKWASDNPDKVRLLDEAMRETDG